MHACHMTIPSQRLTGAQLLLPRQFSSHGQSPRQRHYQLWEVRSKLAQPTCISVTSPFLLLFPNVAPVFPFLPSFSLLQCTVFSPLPLSPSSLPPATSPSLPSPFPPPSCYLPLSSFPLPSPSCYLPLSSFPLPSPSCYLPLSSFPLLLPPPLFPP